MGYNYIDLFHGIGGFALGAHWSGLKFKNHFCSDVEPYAQKLYKLRFPDSMQLGDITKINTEELKKYGDKWIITGGFPCQDISIAGKGAGITGERSGLWFEYWRLINDLRPDFAIMENVGMLVRRGLREILGGLSDIGYNAEWQSISANEVGAWHKRERIWIISYPDKMRLQRRSPQYNIFNESKTIQRFSRGFGTKDNLPSPRFCRGIDGIPGKVDRLIGTGNAIVPQIAELLFNQIKPHILQNIS